MTVSVDNTDVKLWPLHVAARIAGITPAQLAASLVSNDIAGRVSDLSAQRLLATNGLVNGHRLQAWLDSPEGAVKVVELRGAQP